VALDEALEQIVINYGGGIPDSFKKRLDQVIDDLNDHLADLDNPHQTGVFNLTDVVLDTLIQGEVLTYHSDTDEWRNTASQGEAWPSGLVDGGEINIGPGPNDIEVIAGNGVVVDSYTNPLQQPLVTPVTWAQINEPITAAPSVGGSIVWFTIDDTGTLQQWAQSPTPEIRRDQIFIGITVHDGDVWGDVSSPQVINNTAHSFEEFAKQVLGPTFIIDGGSIHEDPLHTLRQDAGTVWETNRNWHINKKDPHREDFAERDPLVFKYVTQDFSSISAPTSTIDAMNYDVGGVVTPVGGNPNISTIQRLYIDPRDNIWILYGQTLYFTFDEALALIGADDATIIVPDLLKASVLMGYIVTENNQTDWSFDESRFVVASGRSGAGGGGGSPITQHDNLTGITPDNHHNQVHLLYGTDHSDVDSTGTPADGDLLAFNSGSGLWELIQSTFTPDTFTGAGTTGYVPDPLTETGKTLKDNGTWSLTVPSHTHDTADIVSGTFVDARIAQSNVTQHQAALSIAGSQLTGTIDGGTF